MPFRFNKFYLIIIFYSFSQLASFLDTKELNSYSPHLKKYKEKESAKEQFVGNIHCKKKKEYAKLSSQIIYNCRPLRMYSPVQLAWKTC